ncbi:MAG: peptidase S8, partial [Actinobacteria bacterium]|nr:peptidase S8 [Actinomycetota bacterium]
MGALTRVAAAVAVALGLMLGSAASAWAVPSDQERADGLWYAKALKFDELQAAGHTGKGVKIAVIDDGINTA